MFQFVSLENLTMEVSEIWATFNSELRIYVIRKVNDAQMANDIIQDVFEKVIKNLEKLQNVENIQEYLYKMTRNTIVDSYRSRKLIFEQVEHNTLDSSVDFIDDGIMDEKNAESLNTVISNSCIIPFINQLPEKYREALIASEINHLNQKELAAQLNISYSGAKSRVQRGKEKLKSMLQECCNFEHDGYGNLIQQKSKNCSC